MSDPDLWDVVVVGGGAAGLSAALVLAQARRAVLVLDEGRPRNRYDDHMHGYLSRDGLPPAELLRLGREEVERFGGVIRPVRVTGAERTEGGGGWPRFTLALADGSTVRARRLLVATGLTDTLPEVEGIEPFWGHEVFHCPYCHGTQIPAGAVVGVLAKGPEAVLEAHLLLQWADRVVLLTNDVIAPSEDEVAGLEARGVTLRPGRVTRALTQGDRLVGVVCGGEELALDELLVSPSTRPNRELLDRLGVPVVDEPAEGTSAFVETDPGGQTEVGGVYVTGNVRDSGVQVIDAAGHGVRTAIALSCDLTEELVDEAVVGAT